MTTSRKYSTVRHGVFSVMLPFYGGQRMFIVKKGQTMNPSARGGAYKDQWTITNGPNMKFYGDTRTEAVERMAAALEAKYAARLAARTN